MLRIEVDGGKQNVVKVFSPLDNKRKKIKLQDHPFKKSIRSRRASDKCHRKLRALIRRENGHVSGAMIQLLVLVGGQD